MAHALQAEAPGAHHEAIDPTGPMPSVAHSLFIPDRSPAQQPSLALQAGTLQVETRTSRWVKQTPVPAAGVPALDGPTQAFQDAVPGEHHQAMDPTGPMPSVAILYSFQTDP